ncbi:type II toxin-antitoxin system antitoxin, RelB/DinJ family [Mergibacter septicus]|uniref:Type II toxin-antitoxin system antitoxin, RelB/DinJ family n=1 Tax=Mergibacter septicus TaxID=221402 RepID=A0A8D4IY42_9PAST|nr:type II toxin-antitoxin system RelB/DinJ family antitoxin [Mergibacter septicus]AWX13546.1 type II toxin-antitoxin system antitoxin, RelB/DinJ family [Mergibacter septicus]AWX15491.1 type II toxin-antitoxin system antitoxin, RelB/DinJ family [Mergibacter septicus]QDJ14744.1 type II toxin-antitoxin system antitoxin, RelB/DinJ family [Mergibacter septicus]UTU47828.1 type II toxin-antitoxin system RelB/DinJ family antitoxin [Mergibacter septicus]WMR96566.1 type II toxin-antitoxin system RelB/D
MSRSNAAFSFRVAESVKIKAFQVIEEYGLTPSQVLNLFLTEIANTKTIPVNLSYLKPNKATLEAIHEVRSGKAERYNTNTNNFFNTIREITEEINEE